MIINPYIFGGVDADAQAFITAAGITDTTQKNAINTLVLDLKSYGIWSKFKAIYPMVGGSAFTHKFNLKDPRDLDVAYRLQFINGWTHSATGALPNGTDAYANCFINPSSALLLNSNHISVYSRTNLSVYAAEFGVINSGNYYYSIMRNTDSKTYFRMNRNAAYSESSYSLTTSAIFYLINRGSSSERLFLNGATNNFMDFPIGTNSAPNGNIYFSALNSSGTAAIFSAREKSFASIGDGLTNTEASNFYTAVNAFQVSLSRNV